MGALTATTFILDYIIPVAGAKKYGATKYGLWGSALGMVVGLFIFPPFGLFFGGFIGAMAGELFAGKKGDDALKAGLGVFIGNLVATGMKFGLCGVMLFFYLKEMFWVTYKFLIAIYKSYDSHIFTGDIVFLFAKLNFWFINNNSASDYFDKSIEAHLGDKNRCGW